MLEISHRPLAEGDEDTVVYFVREKAHQAPSCPDLVVSDYLQTAWELGDFKGQAGRSLLFYRQQPLAGKARERVIVVGVGKDQPTPELWREAGGVAVVAALGSKAQKLKIALPEKFGGMSRRDLARALAEGLVLGSYRFVKYRKDLDPEQDGGGIKAISIHAGGDRTIAGAVEQGQVAALAVNAARDMANEPGNHWTPGNFVKAGRELAEKYGLTCKVFDPTALKKMGMGGIIGVSQGSSQPPYLVALEYRAKIAKAPTLLLVGKGLTFDSGGISLKPGLGMQEMKFDMSGGAVVLAVMQAVAQLQPSGINVVGLVPAAENLIGPEALKPGDVINQYNGKSVEVVNTDAEGRLLLADALAYGVKHYRPDAVIDIATLTGAVIIALGHHFTGLLSNDDALVERLLTVGDRCGEPLWRLPLGKEYRKQLKSEVADLRNVGQDRAAGTITAACFLQEFVGKTPWAHLDIAGTAWDFTKKSYVPKGPSGVGVRTLLELVLNWK
ncbi:MAG: leucyl aminopeptidase [Desulfobulbaceae bacterium]|nr:leucyl aminopeptidase [Desulfobulbaceae bacterium]